MDNWIQCIKLKVREDQKNFVASNVGSIAQSKFYPHWQPKGIYLDETMIGFIMFGPGEDEVTIIRFMIDQEYQGNGYGRAALKKAIEELSENPAFKEINLSFEPENEVAKKLYESFGFKDTGEIDEGEIVYKLELERK